MRRIALVVLALGAARCATVINDQSEKIAVNSDPPGAVVSVACGSAPIYGGITPAVIIIERAADPCSVTLGREGYEEKTVELRRETSRAMRINKVPGVIGGAILGLAALLVFGDDAALSIAYDAGAALGEAPANAIDRRTGAAYKHVPGKVLVRLDPAP